jgi:hypothetical protein
MSMEWEQYRERYLSERPETYDAYVSVWTTDPDVRHKFAGWVTFGQCANAEPAKRRDVPHLVEQAEAIMRRHGYEVGPSTARGGRRWIRANDSTASGAASRTDSKRHYTGTDVRRALDAFGQHDGLEANKRSAMDVIDRLAASRSTEVSSVYWRDGDSGAVAVQFADEPGVNAAEIHYGYVWHRDQLPGAEPSSRAGSWHTVLPENRIRGANNTESRITEVECPNDPGMMVPITGACMCGWSPADEE